MFREMRRFKQQLTDEKVKEILSTSKRGVLSLIGDDGYPYGIPINFIYDEDDGKIYFHSAAQGHKIDSIKKCGKACFTTWDAGYKEDGDWAWYINSVVAMGTAELVEDRELAYKKAYKFGLKYFPTKEENEAELKKSFDRVQLIALNIEHITGKLVHEK